MDALQVAKRVGINGHVYEAGTTLAQIVENDPDFPGGPDGAHVAELVNCGWLVKMKTPPKPKTSKKTTTRPARDVVTREDADA